MTVIHEKGQTLMKESEKRIHRQEFEKYETVLSGISKMEHSVYRMSAELSPRKMKREE